MPFVRFGYHAEHGADYEYESEAEDDYATANGNGEGHSNQVADSPIKASQLICTAGY